jgi:uncharacterized protein (TIGR00661 family)
MAKIIYGVAGEGRGHSSRSRTIIEYLISQGHEVKIFTSRQGYDYLNQFFDDVYDIFGLELVFKEQDVDVFNTIKKNLDNAGNKGYKSLREMIKVTNEFKPDFNITDFEPLVPFVSRLLNIPFYSINHQNFIFHSKLEYPRQWQNEFLKASVVADGMYWFAKKYYVTSFYFPEIKKRFKDKAVIFGPVLRKEVLKQKVRDNNKILMYTTTPEAQKILKMFDNIDEEIVAYGFKDKKDTKNIKFKKPSTDGFLKDLAECKAVITGGGYSLMSEALYLNKPIYSIPIKGQFEQMINGYYLEKLNYGLYDLNPNKKRLMQFFDGLDFFRKNIKHSRKKFTGNKYIFKELKEIVKKHKKSA